MTVWVNLPAAAAAASGLAVLLGLIWLLRGGRAAARMCAVAGIADVAAGLATGGIVLAAAGVVTPGTVCGCLHGMPGSGRRRTDGGA